jgi:hypothetical protein
MASLIAREANAVRLLGRNVRLSPALKHLGPFMISQFPSWLSQAPQPATLAAGSGRARHGCNTDPIACRGDDADPIQPMEFFSWDNAALSGRSTECDIYLKF